MAYERRSPVLDRQLTVMRARTRDVAGGSVFTYATSTSDPRGGQWYRETDTRLTIGLAASEGGAFPTDLSLPLDGVLVSVDGGAAVTLQLTTFSIVRDPLGHTPLRLVLDFGATLPNAGDSLTLTLPAGATETVTETVEERIWAQRRDYHGRDFQKVVGGVRLQTLSEFRFVVRAESGPWTPGDFFEDDNGESHRVLGWAQIDRQYLEILSQAQGRLT